MKLGDLASAITCYHKAISLMPKDPEAHWNLSLAFLLQGNWKEGWEEFDWRLQRQDDNELCQWRTPAIAMWTGSV